MTGRQDQRIADYHARASIVRRVMDWPTDDRPWPILAVARAELQRRRAARLSADQQTRSTAR